MNKQEFEKVLAFYKNVIQAQIIKPQDIDEILLLCNPNAVVMQPYYKKMREISLFVQGKQQQVVDGLEELFADVEPIPDTDNPMHANYVDKTETASTETSTSLSTDNLPQSHKEVVKVKADKTKPEDEHIDFPAVEDAMDIVDEIAELEEEYLVTTDSNRKRSITMRLKALKK